MFSKKSFHAKLCSALPYLSSVSPYLSSALPYLSLHRSALLCFALLCPMCSCVCESALRQHPQGEPAAGAQSIAYYAGESSAFSFAAAQADSVSTCLLKASTSVDPTVQVSCTSTTAVCNSAHGTDRSFLHTLCSPGHASYCYSNLLFPHTLCTHSSQIFKPPSPPAHCVQLLPPTQSPADLEPCVLTHHAVRSIPLTPYSLALSIILQAQPVSPTPQLHDPCTLSNPLLNTFHMLNGLSLHHLMPPTLA